MSRREYRDNLPNIVAELRARADEHAPDASAKASAGLSVVALADTTIVRIYDEISPWGVDAVDVINALDGVATPNLRVELNSPGGSVFDGIAIYNVLRSHDAHVTVRVDGLAASIASVIAQAGDTRIMQPASQMMIHNAHGLVVGDRTDHGDMAKLLEQQDGVIAGIYAARSGRDASEFRALMDDETWLTDQAAVDLGLADHVGEPNTPATQAAPTQPPARPEPVASIPFGLVAAQAQRHRLAAV